jgi:alpha-amylase
MLRAISCRLALIAGVSFALALSHIQPALGNPWNGKVVFQAFWWNCENQRYGDAGWYNYLAKLAPRLRELGFDGIWVPPSCKGQGGGYSMGYDPFDPYDLGQKDQKGTVPTRFGTLDEFQRLVAVAHANGLEVYPDIVINHFSGADQDPDAPPGSTKYSRFSYRGFAGEGRGRWPKGWADFHPNYDHWETGSVITDPMGFGSDVCFRGSCGNANGPRYMRDQAREWLVWLHKLTGVDGFRFDMVKHYPADVVEDLLYNAMGSGKEYFAVGEYMDTNRDELDGWVSNAQNRCGTFDFSFRDKLLAMVRGQGFFDMGSLPSAQQANRYKTVPFVNNHDTYKGAFWDSGDENSLGHDDNYGDRALIEGKELQATIDPDDPRADVAYAAALAIDGSPVVFYDDLFVNYLESRRKADPDQHPTRAFLENLVWCHQKLNFKDGAYRVPFQGSQDLLVIERAGHALIGLNDNGVYTLKQWVSTSFGANVQLHDYSGSNQWDIWTNQDGWVEVTVPPMSYAIWGPAGITGGFNPPARATRQEFQMDDDLGDASTYSPKYGGKLIGDEFRTGGAVWVAAGTRVQVWLYADDSREAELRAYKPLANGSKSIAEGHQTATGGTGKDQALYLSFTAEREGYHLLQAKLLDADPGPIRGYIIVEYQAPAKSNLIGKP